MEISVFGLGYVGCVSAGCLVENGHSVVGVDINPRKVETVKAGSSPVDEPGLDERFENGVAEGRLTATTDPAVAIAETDVSIIAVGTPLDNTGQLSTTNLYNVVDSVVEQMPETDEHTFVVRSTVPPGTTRHLRSYLRDKLSEPDAATFVMNPEFIREGTAVEDFYDPPYVVLGQFEGSDIDDVRRLYESLDIDAPVNVVEPELAEALKFVSNTFHALKITFANEVGSIAAQLGIDGKALMDLVCADTKLNISPSYLEPGMSFGGYCLPKDNQALAKLASDAGVDTPLLKNIHQSNTTHLERISDRIDDLDLDRIGIIGLSFKHGTTDMLDSPAIELMQLLDTEAYLYGESVDISEFVGSNRDYIDRMAPDIESRILDDPDAFLDAVDGIVFTNGGSYPEIRDGMGDHVVFDPMGAMRHAADECADYHPLVW